VLPENATSFADYSPESPDKKNDWSKFIALYYTFTSHILFSLCPAGKIENISIYSTEKRMLFSSLSASIKEIHLHAKFVWRRNFV